MAQFDVFRLAAGDLVLDCQSDLLRSYNSRFVVPLLSPATGLPAVSRLNPIFVVDDQRLVMMTEFATSVPARELKMRIGSLARHHFAIIGAIDYLLGA